MNAISATGEWSETTSDEPLAANGLFVETDRKWLFLLHCYWVG